MFIDSYKITPGTGFKDEANSGFVALIYKLEITEDIRHYYGYGQVISC